MKFQITKGKTSKILTVFILDNSLTTGAGLSGLDQTSGIIGGYVREGETGVALAVDENVTTEGTYQAPTTAGQIRIGTPANMRVGTYEFHIHNDLLATGADALTITLGGATNMADLTLEIQLTDFDLNLAIQPTNIVQLNGGAQSLLDLKDFADDGYDPATNKLQGLVLCDLTTSLTNLPSIPANWLTATGITAGALDGKGDWNIGKTGYSISGIITTFDGLNNFNPATEPVANVTNVSVVTTLTNLPAITANWLTAAGINAGAFTQSKFGSSFIQSSSFTTGALNAAAIASNAFTAVKFAAGALNGKGDWNIGKTGYSLAATGLDAIASTAIGMVEMAKAVWDRVLTGATHNIPASAGRRIRSVGDVVSGTVNDAAATTTSFISTLIGAHDDHFSDQTLFFTDGALAGMSRIITTFTSATNEVTFDEPLPAAPGNGDAFDVSPVHVHTRSQTAKAIWDRIISKANHNIGQSAGKVLRQGSDLVQIDGSVSDAAPTVGGFDTTLTQPDGYFPDAVLIFSNGAANAGTGKPISTYLNANGAVTFLAPDDWPVVPVDGDDFVIYATHVHPINQIVDGVLTTQMTESYAANGVAPTLEQAQFAMHQMIMQFGISGVNYTVRKLDDSTIAFVVTLDDAVNPTGAKRV